MKKNLNSNKNFVNSILAIILKKDISKLEYEKLTKNQEKELILRIRNNDTNALQELIKYNMRHIYLICSSYAKNNNITDLISEAIIGYEKATHTFNLDMNLKFNTYADWYIRKYILIFLQEDQTIHIPNYLYKTTKLKLDYISEINEEHKIYEIESDQDIQLEIENTEMLENLNKIILNLPRKEKAVIIYSFGLYDEEILTIKQISKRLNLIDFKI